MNLRRLQNAIVVAALLTAALYTGRALFGAGGLYATVLREGVLLRAAAVCKLALLTLAAVHAYATASRLEADNPARRSWRFLALALAAFALGQAVLSGYQLVKGDTPFPSLGDLFFLAAYPLLIAAFFGFIRTYREAGYPVGTGRQHALIAVLVAVLAGVIAVPILRPVLAADDTPLKIALNAAYPLLDFVLLVPMIILLRVAWPFRGGAIFRAWGAILGGVVSLCAGDLLFAWFSMLGELHLDPLLHGSYLLGYVCFAMGTRLHRDLIAS
jgi:diguanylate cyclase